MLLHYPVMHKILLGLEFFSALVGFIYFFRLKNTYWKWFSVYLIVIFIIEFLGNNNVFLFNLTRQEYYSYIGVPFQFLFLFWLYALKSLKKLKLYVAFTLIYISTYYPVEIYYKKINLLYSLNLTVGTILLTFLIVMEYIKQIQDDNILEFKRNKMFYINIGVLLFYVGTYPFFAFQDVLSKKPYIEIWNIYYIYFLLSNCIMYLFFTASFIWGKHQ